MYWVIFLAITGANVDKSLWKEYSLFNTLIGRLEMLDAIGTVNIVVLGWFVLCWVGYTLYADNSSTGRHTLLSAMRDKRLLWMQRMIERENRMVDANIMATLMRSVSLFASTTIFILAGLLAVLGSADKAQALLHDIPFAVSSTSALWEVKILLMLVIFV